MYNGQRTDDRPSYNRLLAYPYQEHAALLVSLTTRDNKIDEDRIHL